MNKKLYDMSIPLIIDDNQLEFELREWAGISVFHKLISINKKPTNSWSTKLIIELQRSASNRNSVKRIDITCTYGMLNGNKQLISILYFSCNTFDRDTKEFNSKSFSDIFLYIIEDIENFIEKYYVI